MTTTQTRTAERVVRRDWRRTALHVAAFTGLTLLLLALWLLLMYIVIDAWSHSVPMHGDVLFRILELGSLP
jgi:hypothetical protein